MKGKKKEQECIWACPEEAPKNGSKGIPLKKDGGWTKKIELPAKKKEKFRSNMNIDGA